MADEQDWSAYANKGTIAATDTFLVREAGGAGMEATASALFERLACGDVYAGVDVPLSVAKATADLQARIGALSDGRNCLVRLQGRTAAGANRYTDILHDAENSVFSIYAPSSGGGTIKGLSIGSTGNVYSGSDGTKNLGGASNRWATVYAATGTINTSDEREKTWRGAMSDDEYTAALQIIDELGFYQWNDSVAEKGDDARYHFGARAQRVFAIIDAHLGEGAWHRYAFACHDSWDDEFEPVYEEQIVPAVYGEGEQLVTPEHTIEVKSGETRKVREAGDRHGLRTDQFTMFLLAAQARRQGELEARIDAIEASLA